MFERFTDRARRIVVLAQHEARDFKHNFIGSEHLLLALIREGGGVAAQVLADLGVTHDDAVAQVETIIGRGQQDPQGHIPFTPRGKRILELSLREALQMGCNYIGTEHLLLGLIREGEGVGARILAELGHDLELVRKVVYTKLNEEIRARVDVAITPLEDGEDIDDETHALRMIEYYTEVAREAEQKRWATENAALGNREADAHATLQKLADLRQRAEKLREAMALAMQATEEFTAYLQELPDVEPAD